MPPRDPFSGVLSRRLLPLFLFANLLLLLHYIVIDYRFLLNSDSAVRNLLAQEIVETGRYFPPEWNYVNSDLWVFFSHTLVLPLLKVLPNSFIAHAATALVTAAMVLAGAWVVTGMLGQSRGARLVSLLVLTGGMSINMAENIFGQGAYGTLFWEACFLLWGFWQGVHAAGRAHWGWAALVVGLALLLCWSNPTRAAVYFILPLLVAGAALLWHDAQAARALGRRVPLRSLAWLGIFLLGCAAGVVLHVATLRLVHNNAGLSLLQWLDFKGMTEHLLGMANGLLRLFEAMPTPNTPVLSPLGIYQALRLVAGLALLVLLPWALWRALHSAHKATQFFAAFTGTVLAANLFIILTTGVADMSAPESSVRYLAPPLLGMLLLLAGALVDRRDGGPLLRMAGGAALLLLAFAAPNSYSTYYNLGYFPSADEKANTAEGRALHVLQQHGLQYGYALFWNAGRMTVLAGQQTRLRPVSLQDGLPMPMRHLSSNRWYWAQSWQGPTFLLLTDTEAQGLDQKALFARTGQPSQALAFNEWRLWIFPHNIARDLPWDTGFRQPASFPVGPQSQHVVGHVTGDALVAEPGENGVLMFGPGLTVDKGRYVARFEVDGDTGDYGRIDVASMQGKNIHAVQLLKQPGAQQAALAFTLEQPVKNLEFRAISNGTGRMTVRGVRLERQPDVP